MYNCKYCGKLFKKKYNYERHINKKISCHNKLQCKKCFKIFKYKGDYDRHLNRKSDCSMDIYKIEQNNYKMQLDLSNKDNEILKKDNQLLKNKIEKLENEIKILNNKNIYLCSMLNKNNINHNITNNNCNNKITNNINGNNNNNIRLNIQVYTNHVTPEILKQLELKATKIIKQHKSKLPDYDKETEQEYNEYEKICCQYLEDIIKYIWKNKEIPENNIIRYLEKTYLKYSGNINKKKWDILSYEEIKEYILKTIYKICEREKIKKEDMNRKLKSILMNCSLHPKYDMRQYALNKTFFNLMEIAIKKTLEII